MDCNTAACSAFLMYVIKTYLSGMSSQIRDGPIPRPEESSDFGGLGPRWAVAPEKKIQQTASKLISLIKLIIWNKFTIDGF